jgi:drug/metabolite transporter (DMT)-like permease
MSYVCFLIICAIWGASFILMNRAGLALSPLAVGGWRVFGGAAVLLVALLYKRIRPQVSLQDLGYLVVVGLVAYAWPYGIQPYLVVRHDHGFVGMSVALVPLFTIMFSVPMLGAMPTLRQAVGVGGGLLCMGVILLDGQRRGIGPLDLAIMLSIPASYAFGNILIKRRLNHLSSLVMTLVTLGIASAALLPAACLPEAWLSQVGLGGPTQPGSWPVAIASLIVLATLGTGLAMLLFNHLVVHEGPLFAGMVTYIVPLGAVAWSWVDSGHVSMLQLVALGGVLAMVALVQYGAARPRIATTRNLAADPPTCPQESA